MSAVAAETSGEHRVLLDYRVGRLEQAVEEAVSEMRNAVESIDRSLQALSRVQEHYARMQEQFLRLAKRTGVIELELPTLKLIRQWVIAGVIGVVAAVGYAAIALVLR